MIDASIVIRTKNEARDIGRTLHAVLTQTPGPAEVLIVDSGSTDETLSIAETFPVDIVEMDSGGWSYPRALNLGGRKTSGSFIVSLSAHCVPVSRYWLRDLTRHFEDHKVAGVWGPSVAPRRDVDLTEVAVRQTTYSYDTRGWGLDNANSAIRRDLWQEFPFDESLPATEDKAWGIEALARGFELVYEPAAAVRHENHGVRSSYRRAVKVAQGYNIIFPEEERHSVGGLSKVTRAAGGSIGRNLRSPSLASLGEDLYRGLSLLATLAGFRVGSRKKVG